jgi:cytochrome c biogenesis protein CcmG/thiol:disulfide interchange protein DsbE
MEGMSVGPQSGAPRGGRHLARNVAIAAAVVLLAFVALLATRKTGETDRAEAKILGQAVPAVQGTTLDGTSYDISTHRGSWVVVNFFAHWCPPCVQEQPELVAFAEEHRAAGDVQLVGVAFQDKESDVRDFFAKNGGDWPVLVGDTGAVPLAFGVTKVPESYVVSPDGQVVAKFEGVTKAKLDAVINQFEAQAGASNGGTAR